MGIFHLDQNMLWSVLSISSKEGRIFLSDSSQGESSVMRVRLEGRKKTITNMH